MKRNMRKILFFGVVVLLLAIPVSVGAIDPSCGYEAMDIGPEIRTWDATLDLVKGPLPLATMSSGSEAMISSNGCILDTKIFLIADTALGYYYLDEFYLMADGTSAQVWVQADLSWPAGDPRPTPVITCEQAQYMLSEFENNILPTESAFFGPADIHDGSASLIAPIYFTPDYYYDATGRQIILVSNIRDPNYYSPDVELYIGGFYSPALEVYIDRNIISVDAYDWENRLGPDCSHPYGYEGISAHEYQHLLHDDYDPLEEEWINEGLSDWAIYLCGYGIHRSHVEDFALMPENSLVVWGDQGDEEILADYGVSYLYQQYMYEQYGTEFLQREFLDSAYQGIASVDAVLAAMGESETFAATFHAFSVALYTKGAFDLLDLVEFQVDTGHPGKRNPDAYATPGSPPWGTDYYLIWGYEQIGSFQFNGVAFRPSGWTTNGDVLWSGAEDLADNWAIFETTGGGTLTFDTNYVIEDYWDFGFVQVSTDGGYTWTSLANAYTTTLHDPSAHPDIVAQLPGLTGYSGGWQTIDFDLSPYAGQDILIGFRYMTDWASLYDGWYIDNVSVDGTLISDGSSMDPFQSLDEVLGLTNEYTVTLIGERIRKGKPEYEVLTLISGDYESDWESIRDLIDTCRLVVMLVTYDAEQGEDSYLEYSFRIDHKGGKHLV